MEKLSKQCWVAPVDHLRIQTSVNTDTFYMSFQLQYNPKCITLHKYVYCIPTLNNVHWVQNWKMLPVYIHQQHSWSLLSQHLLQFPAAEKQCCMGFRVWGFGFSWAVSIFLFNVLPSSALSLFIHWLLLIFQELTIFTWHNSFNLFCEPMNRRSIDEWIYWGLQSEFHVV